MRTALLVASLLVLASPALAADPVEGGKLTVNDNANANATLKVEGCVVGICQAQI
jgi:hypothetical protein